MNDKNYRERLLIIQSLFKHNLRKKMSRADIGGILKDQGIIATKETIGSDIEVLSKFMPIFRKTENHQIMYYFEPAKIIAKQCTPSDLPGYPCMDCTAQNRSDKCQCIKWREWAKNLWHDIHIQGMQTIKTRDEVR